MPPYPFQLSRGALRTLNLLRWYQSRHTRVFPSQKKLGSASQLNVGERQVRRYLHELEGCHTDRCPEDCNGIRDSGHVGLIQIRQGGNGRTACYLLTGGIPRQNVRVDDRPDVRADVQAEIGSAIMQLARTVEFADENVRAERRSSRSPCSTCSSVPSHLQYHSALVNDVVGEKPSHETQNEDREPMINEIWSVVEPRAVVQCSLTKGNKKATLELLEKAGSVEVAKRTILLACFDKLKVFLNPGDDSPIRSMRYFIPVVGRVHRAQVQLGGGVEYWQHL